MGFWILWRSWWNLFQLKVCRLSSQNERSLFAECYLYSIYISVFVYTSIKLCSVTMNEIDFFFFCCDLWTDWTHKYILVFYGIQPNRPLYSEFLTTDIGRYASGYVPWLNVISLYAAILYLMITIFVDMQ